jgi:hypothetical protein
MFDFTKHFSTKTTPQSEPIPGTNQVANSAGGFAWQLPVTAGPAGYRRDWYSYIPESSVGRIAALIAVVAAVILVFPLVVAAVVLYFVVLPRLTGGRRWGYRGGPMSDWAGRPRQWRR